VLTAPFFGAAFRIPKVLDPVARALSCLAPTCPIGLPRWFQDQPDRITLRWWTETLGAQELFRRRAEQFQLPVLLLHGQRDGVACPSTARALFDRLGSRDKTFRILPGAQHGDLDPIWGPDWWNEVRDWLESRVHSAAPPTVA
jgi:alpha-beta hydrolase superfamily lysophospholipase